jgi:hypothetical protein
VERNPGDQDRLVSDVPSAELRLAGISAVAEVNRFLRKVYLPKINRRFIRPPASKDDAHVPFFGVDMAEILCFEYELTVSNDSIARFEKRLFQILKENHGTVDR